MKGTRLVVMFSLRVGYMQQIRIIF